MNSLFRKNGKPSFVSVNADNNLTVMTDNSGLETLTTATNQKLDDIETALQLIDNAVDGAGFNVNLNIANTDVASNSGNKNAQTQRVVIATDDIPIALVNTNLVALEASLASIETDIEATNTLLGTIDSDTNDIKTAVELLDNAIDGAYLNTNINIQGGDVDSSSGNLSSKTQRICLATDDIPLALVNTNLVALEASLTSMESKMDTDNVVFDNTLTKITANETLLTAIDADTNAIKTAVELLDNALDGNYLNVNLNIAGGDINSSSGNLSSKTQRICIATDDIPIALVNTNLVALETSLTAMEGKQDTSITHLGEIEGAVESLELCITSNKLQVDVISGGATAPTHGSVDIGSSLEDNELSPVIDTNGYCEISIHFAVNESGDSAKKLNVMGSTAEGGSYFTFAMLYLDNNSSYSGDGADEKNYCYRTGTNELTAFIPCAYRYIKIKNTTGTIITGIDGDDIRYIMKV